MKGYRNWWCLCFFICLVIGGRVGAQSPTYSAYSELQAQPVNEKFLLPVKSFRVVDGDTAYFVLNNGQTLKTRFLLIDTPELHHPRLGEQPFGREAKQRVTELLRSAKKLDIEYDIGTHKDKYHRDLVYVWVDGHLLQEILVQEGLAQVAYVYPPNTRYLHYLEDAQILAKNEKRGLWTLYGPNQ